MMPADPTHGAVVGLSDQEQHRHQHQYPQQEQQQQLQQQQRPHSTRITCRRGCSRLDAFLQNTSERIVNHILWKLLIGLFTLVLLFGPPLLVLVPYSDDFSMNTLVNGLYVLGFICFSLDMLFRCYYDPTYFPCGGSCQLFQRRRSAGTGGGCCRPRHRSSGSAEEEEEEEEEQPATTKKKKNNNNNIFGSFSFWCDFSSTICFILEITWLPAIDHFRYDNMKLVILLGPQGFATQDSFASVAKLTESFFSRRDIPAILLMFKTARVARLISTANVVITARWLVSACYFWRPIVEQYETANRARRDVKTHDSWGGFAIATQAYHHAAAAHEQKMKEKGQFVFCRYKSKQGVEKALRFLGILPNTNIYLNRQIAATRIQRAWKNRDGNVDTSSTSERIDASQAWSGTGTESRASQHMARSTGRVSIQQNVHIVNGEEKDEEPMDTIGTKIQRRRRISKRRRENSPSKIGNKMSELTGHRCAIFLLLNLLMVVIFTYNELDTTMLSTMVMLHGQTTTTDREFFVYKAVDTARRSAIPTLIEYHATSTTYKTNFTYVFDTQLQLRDREKKTIEIKNNGGVAKGVFNIRYLAQVNAVVELGLVFFFVLIWFFGVAAFAGPIAALVILPIERAMKLLKLLVTDPLGYRNTLDYKLYLADTDEIYKKSGWGREILKGMETEFLMSTIDRIGSLMKVGYGSAGVEIIRNNLKEHNSDILTLNSQGSVVSCIFLFCDIRGFTDATECLQEEIFVFTNRIAAVVHSFCNSFGGAANKNIGDAFLVSWRLDDGSIPTKHQADKALLSSVRISMALHHNNYYIETMSDHARYALLDNLKDRPGPTVQLGFGLHQGKAVEGAIGSRRKIDATYVSAAVNFAEHLECSTKKYKVPMLMSDSFHRLLSLTNRRRCRKIDQVMFEKDDDEFHEDDICNRGELQAYFTYDIDVDALWEDAHSDDDNDDDKSISDDNNTTENLRNSKRGRGNSIRSSQRSSGSLATSIRSVRSGSIRSPHGDNQNITAVIAAAAVKAFRTTGTGLDETKTTKQPDQKKSKKKPELVLPTGPALYSENIWLQADMRKIRRRYTTEIFSTYNKGMQKYYAKDWDEAKLCFESIIDRFEDGPSRYFLDDMKNHNGVPPPNFKAWGSIK